MQQPDAVELFGTPEREEDQRARDERARDENADAEDGGPAGAPSAKRNNAQPARVSVFLLARAPHA